MARVTFVKKTQQRYVMVPVLDENGKPKRTPVMGRSGEQRTTKTGRLVFMDVTVADKSRPKPDLKCESCGEIIPVGDPHKHVTPKSGPYGGSKRVRCAKCPTWQVWDLSNSLSASLARISHEAQEAFAGGVESVDDVEAILSQAAEEIRGLAEEKREGASNIEDGFGHPTSMSEELNDTADSLDSWADDVEQAEVPDAPDETEYVDHEFEQDEDEDAEDGKCGVEGCDKDESEHDSTLEDAMDTWRDEAADALSVLDESPV